MLGKPPAHQVTARDAVCFHHRVQREAAVQERIAGKAGRGVVQGGRAEGKRAGDRGCCWAWTRAEPEAGIKCRES